MRVKHKTRPRASKYFPQEYDHPIPDSWIEKFVSKTIAAREDLVPYKSALVDLCRDFYDAAHEYKTTFHAFDHLRFACDKDGNIDRIFIIKTNDYVLFKRLKPEFLLNLQNVLEQRGSHDHKAYKAVMAEIQRRVDSGCMYPDKGEMVA